MITAECDAISRNEIDGHLDKLRASIELMRKDLISRDEFEQVKKQVAVDNQVINLLVGMVNFLRKELDGMHNGELDSKSN